MEPSLDHLSCGAVGSPSVMLPGQLIATNSAHANSRIPLASRAGSSLHGDRQYHVRGRSGNECEPNGEAVGVAGAIAVGFGSTALLASEDRSLHANSASNTIASVL